MYLYSKAHMNSFPGHPLSWSSNGNAPDTDPPVLTGGQDRVRIFQEDPS